MWAWYLNASRQHSTNHGWTMNVIFKSITTHPEKRMTWTYIVRGGLQKCPTYPSCKTDDLLVGPAWKLRLACRLGSFCSKSELRPQNKKKEPPKQQRTNSITLSDFQGANEIHLAFVSSLFHHLVCKSWVGHPACKPIDLNLLWGWSTLHFVGWVVMF
jgi:hypothetical protein